MQHLLKIEWLKVKHYGAFKILSILFAAGIFLTNFIVYKVNKDIVGNVESGGLIQPFNLYGFDRTWQTTSYVTGFLLILPAMLLIILITNEFSFRTSRQNIIDGLSRREFINVKLMIALIIALISTVLVFITAIIFGFISGTDFSFYGIENVGFFFLKALSYNLLAVFFSVWLKKTGVVIGLYFVYMGAENIASQMLDVWSMKLKGDGNGDFGSMGDYLPMNASDGLLKFPDNPLKDIAASALPTNYFWVVFSLAIMYLVLFFVLSKRTFQKSDL